MLARGLRDACDGFSALRDRSGSGAAGDRLTTGEETSPTVFAIIRAGGGIFPLP